MPEDETRREIEVTIGMEADIQPYKLQSLNEIFDSAASKSKA